MTQSNAVAILSIGRELLLGHTLDTNAAYLCREVTALGYQVATIRTADDDRESIVAALRDLSAYRFILISGGLGPTPDDLTRQAIADFAGVELVFHEELWQAVERRFAALHKNISVGNNAQAFLPDGALAIPNACGTAPGVDWSGRGTRLFAMPGVPREMYAMFADYVAPLLRQAATSVVFMKRLHLSGVGESAVGEIIRAAAPLSPTAEIGTTVDYLTVTVRVLAAGENLSAAQAQTAAAARVLREKLAPYIFAEDGQTLAATILQILRTRRQKLALAESCTGGLVAAELVDCAGASDVLVEGLVVYSNAAKQRLCGGEGERILREHGAVSRECVEWLAAAERENSGADYAVAVSGVAGPGGGSVDKPVGLVWVAVAHPQGEHPQGEHPQGVVAEEYHFASDRTSNRHFAKNAALGLLLKTLATVG
ncbi:CinA-like protein [Planctomycetales bacterium]|nr:CinA-like protein [Planctomycetales bacterium]GHS99906.1 CinA-like protein [Planctomycetales bacterium]GHT06705.1 CinA-like protein [Planctomycetales bacterium]